MYQVLHHCTFHTPIQTSLLSFYVSITTLSLSWLCHKFKSCFYNLVKQWLQSILKLGNLRMANLAIISSLLVAAKRFWELSWQQAFHSFSQELHRCMRENPRYFISSYDKPVILFMGTHFNALHCAARTGYKLPLSFTIYNIWDLCAPLTIPPLRVLSWF